MITAFHISDEDKIYLTVIENFISTNAIITQHNFVYGKPFCACTYFVFRTDEDRIGRYTIKNIEDSKEHSGQSRK